MMRFKKYLKSGAVIMLLTFSFLSSFSQNTQAVEEINEHRRKQQAEFRDKKQSPLLPKDRKKFKGLNYYPIDLKYRVNAKFTRTENTELFKMKTTTSRLPEYRKYGEVSFTLDSQ